MSAVMDLRWEPGVLEGARSGQDARAAAFRELFERLKEPVLALCLRLCGNQAEAEDALQETFISVHRGLGQFRGESKLSTWVCRIAIRAAFAVRARRPRAPVPLEHALDAVATTPPPDQHAAALERAARTHRAMARLSTDHQVVLSLFAVEGLTHPEIAQVLGVPEGTVWARLHQARKRLLAEMGEAAGSR